MPYYSTSVLMTALHCFYADDGSVEVVDRMNRTPQVLEVVITIRWQSFTSDDGVIR